MLFIKNNITKIIIRRNALFLIADIFLISLAIYLAFLLRFDGQIPADYSETVKALMVLSLAFCLPIFYFLNLYFFSWSYVSTTELISLAKATTLSFLLVGIALYFSRDYYLFYGFPRSTILISYFLTFLLTGGFRFSKRIYDQVFGSRVKGGEKRTLIVGAGNAGEQIIRSIRMADNNSYFPVGFIDDSSSKQGLLIHGLKVLGDIARIPELVAEHHIEEIIIAMTSAGKDAIKRTVEMGRKAGVKKIKVVPSMTEVISEGISVKDVREVQIEDLLGREPVALDTRAIGDFIKGKVVLITGAAGSIGSELSRQTAKFKPSSLILLDQDETGIFDISESLKDKFPNLKLLPQVCDIRDRLRTSYIFQNFKPNIVFHAAAYKHVPLMEEQPEEAVQNNIFGTEILAEAALQEGVENFIFVSTDKSVNPVSVMGFTKRIGEMICQAANQKNHTKFISVRFGNVLDSRGSVIPIFRKQIKKGGPVEVTHPDMKRYFMVNSEAVLLVMEAGAVGKGGEVFVLDMGQPIKILDLAKEMIKFSGFEPDKDIPIVFTAPRPGEKFFEEILTAEEGTAATQYKKIFVAKTSPILEDKLQKGLAEIKLAVQMGDRQRIKILLREITQTYSRLSGKESKILSQERLLG